MVSGYDDGSFGVGKTITREDMAVLAYRILEHTGMSLDSVNEKIVFDDENEISAYALESVGAMQEAGIINGTGDNMFSPKGGATRAMAAKIIYELLQKMN